MEYESDNNRIATMLQLVSQSLLDVEIKDKAEDIPENEFEKDYKQYHFFQYENLEHFSLSIGRFDALNSSHTAYTNSLVEFGKKAIYKIPKTADLIGDIYLKIKLPSLVTHPGYFKMYYVNSIANALIKEITVKHGTDTIYNSTGQFLQILSKYNTNASKQQAVDSMSGTFHTEYSLVGNSNTYNEYYVCIPFWKTEKSRQFFPTLHGLTVADQLEVQIEFRTLKEIVSSELTKDDEDTLTNNNDITIQIFENVEQTGVQVFLNIQDQDFIETSRCDNKFEASLFVDHIYLSKEEKMLFLSKDLEYIIEQNTYEDYVLDTNGYSKMLLNFQNPVKELIIVAFPSTDDNKEVNFQFRKLDSFEFYFNGRKRNESRDTTTDANQYLKLQNHIGIPNQYIYSYSFCLLPYDLQPTGTFNFSENPNNFILVKAKTDIKLTVRVYAIYYNIYEINQQGFGRLRYT